jgi:hypothetical protein
LEVGPGSKIKKTGGSADSAVVINSDDEGEGNDEGEEDEGESQLGKRSSIAIIIGINDDCGIRRRSCFYNF